MAGALTIDTLNASSGAFQTNNAMSGIAKAWASFGYATVSGTFTVYSSFNVSSVSRNSSGVYTLNFPTGTFSDANYVPVVSAPSYSQNNGTVTAQIRASLSGYIASPSLKSSTQLQVAYISTGANYYDVTEYYVVIFA